MEGDLQTSKVEYHLPLIGPFSNLKLSGPNRGEKDNIWWKLNQHYKVMNVTLEFNRGKLEENSSVALLGPVSFAQLVLFFLAK